MNWREFATKTLAALAIAWSLLPGQRIDAADVSALDYPSLQAAVDANHGREIEVPAGDHLIDATLRITGAGTSLVGSGRILMTDPARHILEIEHAQRIRIAGLTFSRPEGKQETRREGILVYDAAEITLERVRVSENRGPGGGIRFSQVRDSRILYCDVQNYSAIAIDDRTANPLWGYAFRCIDGSGIVCTECRGLLIQGNRIIENNLRPTPELQAEHGLGKFTKKKAQQGELVSDAMWAAETTNNWHQGSGLVVTSPTQSEFIRILDNHIENAAQGIDIHADRVIVANNVVTNSFIGMKAMHGSRNVLITGNQFSRNVLWAIGLMPGAAASPGVPAQGTEPAIAANVDGGSLISNNLISQFGYGDSAWLWKDASRAVFRFDRGQETSDPPLRDVLVVGNVISNPDPVEVPQHASSSDEQPRYHFAVRIETGANNSPRNLQFRDNLFPPGTRGVSNVPLEP